MEATRSETARIEVTGPEHRRSTSTRSRRCHRRHLALPLLAAFTLVASVLVSPSAGAGGDGGNHGGGTPRVLAEGLAGPLSIDVDRRGSVLVGQSFSGTATSVSRSGVARDLFNDPGIGAVGWGPFGSVVYATVTGGSDGPPQPGEEPVIPDALLKMRLANGKTVVLADLGAYEKANNPDGDVTYGVELDDECAADWPVEVLGPPAQPGDVNPNPYAVATTRWGVYVADAGANTLYFVTWRGNIHVVSVLPPQPAVITQEMATGTGIPDCAVGLTYDFHPVPTDVEVTPRGLYVSLLPGGAEDDSMGARGSVVRVDPRSGRTTVVGTGLLGATDLAVSPNGTVYVTELYGGRLSKLTRKGPRTVANFNQPVAVEWHRGRLYVASDPFGNGTLSVMNGSC